MTPLITLTFFNKSFLYFSIPNFKAPSKPAQLTRPLPVMIQQRPCTAGHRLPRSRPSLLASYPRASSSYSPACLMLSLAKMVEFELAADFVSKLELAVTPSSASNWNSICFERA